MAEIGLKDAINAISDVVQNRPRPIREFDQIYMKTGDMVIQSEIVANWADARRLAFIGDGDAIGVCVAYLQKREFNNSPIFDFGPSKITVFDFDERQVHSIRSFAERKHIRHLNAELYNARDPFPMVNRFERFYTNPPWGQSNDGESVHVFMERGMEACGHGGQGMVVIADDEELEWPKRVLYTTQKRASDLGYFVSRMQPLMHSYHLDDDALLRSCNLFLEALPGNRQPDGSRPVDKDRLTNFYGRDQDLRMRYIKSKRPLTFEAEDEDDWRPEFYEDTE